MSLSITKDIHLKTFDLIVAGGGHAGCEAAAIGAFLGAKTLLITSSEKDLCRMSCNPSIGGIGKGILVREIDACGGLMGEIIDSVFIYSRMLNGSKGPAVRGPRAQANRDEYSEAARDILSSRGNISLFEGLVGDLILENNGDLSGVITECNQKCFAPRFILCSGTFLGGIISIIGSEPILAGRMNGISSNRLAERLIDRGFKFGRLRTGTPPRLDGQSIKLEECEVHAPDKKTEPFSFLNDSLPSSKVNCFLTRTTEETMKILAEAIKETNFIENNGKVKGPRYCLSIADKWLKNPDKFDHQIFLEPEDVNMSKFYPAGLTCKFPADMQLKIVRSIPGLRTANLTALGYGVEYYFISSNEIKHSLESKKIKGLYFAGQINGTTGYEEAASQGFLAGANAVLSLDGKEFLLNRKDSHIGVMVDDIVTASFIDEPYRVLTARSEYRLKLRPDNADRRLTMKAADVGLVTDARKSRVEEKEKLINTLKNRMMEIKLSPVEASRVGISVSEDGVMRSVFQLLRFNGTSRDILSVIMPEIADFPEKVLEQVFYDGKYAPYIDKEEENIDSFFTLDDFRIPADLNYDLVPGLSKEAKERLKNAAPTKASAASLIYGITPLHMLSISTFIKKKHNLPIDIS